MDSAEIILDRIREVAQSRQYPSLRDLSRALGKSPTYLSAYLLRKTLPPTAILKRLAELGISFEWIMTGTGEKYIPAVPGNESTNSTEGRSMDDPFLSELWNQLTGTLPGVPAWDELDQAQRREIIASLGIEILHLQDKVTAVRPSQG